MIENANTSEGHQDESTNRVSRGHRNIARPEILARLERLEDSYLTGLKEIRTVKDELVRRFADLEMLDPLIDAKQVAELLDVDVKYVLSMARKGEIPSIRIGKYVKFSPRELKRFLDRRRCFLTVGKIS